MTEAEINKLVAERIMFNVWYADDNRPDFCNSLLDSRHVMLRMCELADYKGDIVEHIVKTENGYAKYGSSLKQRFILNLIFIVNPRMPSFDVTCMGNNNWFRTHFQADDLWNLMTPDPKHICLAALKTVGVKID